MLNNIKIMFYIQNQPSKCKNKLNGVGKKEEKF